MDDQKPDGTEITAYVLAKAKSEAQSYRLEAAGKALMQALVLERLAEFKSQHDPLAGLENAIDLGCSKRDALYAAAHYVALGRWPDRWHPTAKPTTDDRP